jgi:hypothetical protein
MAEPIPMKKFRKTKERLSENSEAKRLSSVPPDDWILDACGVKLLELGEDLPLTHVHLMKLRRALREQPERIVAIIRESVVPFIDRLPDPDMTIVGAELPGAALPSMDGFVCNGCLTRREKVRVPKGDIITRDEADRYEMVCVRCGKHL